MTPQPENNLTRRGFLQGMLRGAALVGVAGTVGVLATRGRADENRWQIDPYKCIQCGRCATACVLQPSAAKCVHAYMLCGYCELCTGYFQPQPNGLNTAAENQLCPTGAIRRSFVEDPYYEYTIDEKLCIGCAKCVKGCGQFGNGSLFMQIRHDRCVNCNDCAIAKVCPSGAITRVPASHPYLLKGEVRR